ncbi:MAG: hypothetical protein Q8K96_17065 [Rubrivivax sp.]|nr:hypothetical protein [Rubrivivax sp.]
MPERFTHRGPRTATAALVLGQHLLVAALLLRLGAWPDRGPPAAEQPPLVVRLLQLAQRPPPAQPPATAALPPATRAPATAPFTTATPPAQEPPRSAEPQAITLPPAAAASTPEAVGSAPLNLTLPRAASAPWRSRNPALEDARANSAPATLESRTTQAMGGDGPWVPERLGNDRIRLRRGSECIELQRSRAGQLELANGAFRDLWAGKKC